MAVKVINTIYSFTEPRELELNEYEVLKDELRSDPDYFEKNRKTFYDLNSVGINLIVVGILIAIIGLSIQSEGILVAISGFSIMSIIMYGILYLIPESISWHKAENKREAYIKRIKSDIQKSSDYAEFKLIREGKEVSKHSNLSNTNSQKINTTSNQHKQPHNTGAQIADLKGIGSPEVTTRWIIKEYLNLKERNITKYRESFKMILVKREEVYQALGLSFYDDFEITKLINESKGSLLFLILADLYNANSIKSDIQKAIYLSSLDSIIGVLIDNYKPLDDPTNLSINPDSLKKMLLEYIGDGNSHLPYTGVESEFLIFDTLYICQNQGNAQCLKFFKNGVVISVSIRGHVLNSISMQETINTWFNEGYGHRGKVRVNEDKIKFTIASREGNVDYVGSYTKDELVLSIHSKINNYKSVYRYVITPFR